MRETLSSVPPPLLERPVSAIFRSRIMAALATGLNFLLLNLALVIASVPVVTLPIAIYAAAVALDHWRAGGEDRVVREFLVTLRSRGVFRAWVVVGVPLAAIAVGVEEVHYFFLNDRSMLTHICLGLGLSALLVTVTGFGYVVLLAGRYPLSSVTELWWVCAQLAVRNLLVTGPVFVVEIVAGTVLGVLDPALVLLGVPIVVLNLMRVTAEVGLRRVQARV
jgi:hypothetical protein